MRYKLVQGNNFAWLRSLPDNCIDSFVTDPPYGLGKEPDMAEYLPISGQRIKNWKLYQTFIKNNKSREIPFNIVQGTPMGLF